MEIRAKLATFVCVFLGALLLLIGSPGIAKAHVGHDHQARASVHPGVRGAMTAAPATGVDLQPSVELPAVRHHAASEPGGVPQPLHERDCCCGSVACHAGVAAPAVGVAPSYVTAEKLLIPPLPGAPKALAGGIERPPRGQAAH